jgi:hypothetical protein
MSDIEYGLEGLKLVGSFVLLAFAVRALLSSVLADWRQNLFRIRNELWDGMQAEGLLAHPAHRETRQMINGAIRFGPQMNLINLLAVRVVRPPESIRSSPHDELPPQVVEMIRKAENGTVNLVLDRMLFQTLPGVLIGWPFWAVWRALRLIRSMRSRVDQFASRVRCWFRPYTIELKYEAAERHCELSSSAA